jgi:long-chain acyl-CoA synthetase
VPEFVIALLGAARARVVTVPLNPMYRLPEIEKLAADCGPRAIVCETDHAETVLGAALPGVHRFTVGEGGTFGVAQAGPAGVDTPCDPDDRLHIGHDGQAKGAVVSHANLLAGAQTCARRPGCNRASHSGGSPPVPCHRAERAYRGGTGGAGAAGAVSQISGGHGSGCH